MKGYKKLIPELKTWYSKHKKTSRGTEKQFEVLLVSMDRTEKDFRDHYKEHGNWPALPPQDVDLYPYLLKRYGGEQLVILDIFNGCQISNLTTARMTSPTSIGDFPFGKIVLDWNDNWSTRPVCLKFAPTREETEKPAKNSPL